MRQFTIVFTIAGKGHKRCLSFCLTDICGARRAEGGPPAPLEPLPLKRAAHPTHAWHCHPQYGSHPS